MKGRKHRITYGSLAMVLLALVGCSSPSSVHYYQLPQFVQQGQPLASHAPVLVVEPVMVANYLNSNALVLQTSDVALHKTQQHQWAEALDQQLTRLLVQHLAQSLPNYRITERAPQTPHARVLVQVEQFHGSVQGTVFVSGKFHLTTAEGIIQQQFHWQLPQAEAGYPALVSALGQGWQQLASQITSLLRPDVLQHKNG